MLTSPAGGVPYKNISPAKKLRSIKRLLSFQFNKMKHSKLSQSLSICHQEGSSFPPARPSLSITHVHTKQKLTLARCSQADIPPDPLPCIYCKLVSHFPNLPQTPTGPVPMCCVCTKPVDERFDPHFCCGLVMHPLCLGGHLCWE